MVYTLRRSCWDNITLGQPEPARGGGCWLSVTPEDSSVLPTGEELEEETQAQRDAEEQHHLWRMLVMPMKVHKDLFFSHASLLIAPNHQVAWKRRGLTARGHKSVFLPCECSQ